MENEKMKYRAVGVMILKPSSKFGGNRKTEHPNDKRENMILVPEGTKGADGKSFELGDLLEVSEIPIHWRCYVLVRMELKSGPSFYATPFHHTPNQECLFDRTFLWSEAWLFTKICGYPIPIHD